jgi:hypothetical protein
METNEEILQLAIEKAVKNGWDDHEDWGNIEGIEPIGNCHSVWLTYPDGDGENMNVKELIFSHSFLKAFFGDEEIVHITSEILDIANEDDIERKNLESWQYHAQQMVIAEDPITVVSKDIITGRWLALNKK